MSVNKLTKITKTMIAEKGVQALADRPNSAAQYGQGGLTATQLKLWFDKLATFLADKINEIQDTLAGNNAAKYIRILLDNYGGITSLDELVNSFLSGSFASNVLKVLPSASAQTAVTLQVLINNMAQQIATLREDADDLDADKLDKIVSASEYIRVYTVGTDGTQTCHILSQSAMSLAIPQYDSAGRLKTNTPAADTDAANKAYADARDLLLSSAIVLSIDPNSYLLTVSLKNTKGVTLSSSNVDLPLESLFIGGSYANGILTLKLKNQDGSIDDNVINIDISDIIDGLVSETTFNNTVARLDGRIDGVIQTHEAFVAEVDLSKIYGFAAFHAEEAETSRNFTKGGNIDRTFRKIYLEAGYSLDVTMDSDYKLSIGLKNKSGSVISSKMIDLPIESLMTSVSYANKKLKLTLQNGQSIDVNIGDIISGLVPDSRKINGKALSSDVTLTAADVGAYPTSETYSKDQTDNKVSTAVNTAKNELQEDIEEVSENVEKAAEEAGNFGYYSVESEKTKDCIKGGPLDKRIKRVENTLKALINTTN